MTIPQEQSRVTIQSTLVTALRNSSNKIAASLKNSIVVEGLFIN